MIAYTMERGGETVAHVVTLPSGKCVVSWPTSVVVYDSETDARRVHVDHMGGRGEETRFAFYCAPSTVERGWSECYQDRCEGVPLHAVDWSNSWPVVRAPEYIPDAERADWIRGYEAMAAQIYGTEWREDCGPKRAAQSPAEGGSV